MIKNKPPYVARTKKIDALSSRKKIPFRKFVK
uniref:Uncharacterized protein n=1 Tax=Siphoviridae sp. ctKgQ2 TaxID=2827842 RepID=A0A8S5TLL9_9CAUD|nr:MAG TPA: hypothetical protein [Siphoviridae sp. ctKgQ2]